MDGLTTERGYWDEEYKKSSLAGSYRYSNSFTYEEYFSIYPHHNYVAKFFGNIRDKKILDLGCGTGWLMVYFARSGAKVYGCDISYEGIKKSHLYAEANVLKDKINGQVMEAEHLGYKIVLSILSLEMELSIISLIPPKFHMRFFVF